MRMPFRKQISRLARNDRGATAVEYALILALIMLACFGVVQGLGNRVSGFWNEMQRQVSNAMA